MELKQPVPVSYNEPDFDVAEKNKTPELYAQMIGFYSSFYNRTPVAFNEGEAEMDNTYLLSPAEQMFRWISYYLGRQRNKNFNHIFAGGISAPWINGQKIPQLINRIDGNMNKLLSEMKASTKALSKDAKNRRTQILEDIMLKFDNPEFFNDLEKFGATFKSQKPEKPIYSKEDAERYVEYTYKENSELYGKQIANNLFTKNGMKYTYKDAFKDAVVGGLCGVHNYAINGFVNQEKIPCYNLIWDNRVQDDHNRKGKFRGFISNMTVTEVIRRYKGKGDDKGLSDDDITELKKLARETPDDFVNTWNNAPGFRWCTLNSGVRSGLASVSVVTMYWLALRDTRYKESTDKFGTKVISKINDNPDNEIKKQLNPNIPGDYCVLDVYKGTLIANKYLVDWGLCTNVVRDPYNQSTPLMPIDIYIPNMTIDQYRSYVSRLHELQDLCDAAMYKVCEKWGKDKGMTYLLLGSKLGHIDPQTTTTDLASMGISAVPGNDGEGDVTGANTRSTESLDFRLDPNINLYWDLRKQIEQNMEEIVSIPSVALGQQDPGSGLGVQQGILAESSISISPLYEGFVYFMERNLQYAVNMQKNIYCIEGNEDAEMVIGKRGLEYIKATKDFPLESLGVYISLNNLINDQLRNRLADIAFNLSQSGGINMLDAIKIQTETDLLELQNYLEQSIKRAEKKQEEAAAAKFKADAALSAQNNQAQLQQTALKEDNANARADQANNLKALTEAAKLESQQQV